MSHATHVRSARAVKGRSFGPALALTHHLILTAIPAFVTVPLFVLSYGTVRGTLRVYQPSRG